MPELYTIALLAAAALAMQITPGPDMMLVMGRGVGQGYRIALATALGIASAGFIQLPLLAFGISTLVMSEPWLFDVVRLLGAAYLLYLGIKLVRSKAKSNVISKTPQITFTRAVIDGAVANLLNPKMIVFQLAFIPQFVDPDIGPVWSQMLILGFVMKICGFSVMSVIALTSGATGRWMARHPLWLVVQEKFVGCVMIALGIKLLFDLGAETHSTSN